MSKRICLFLLALFATAGNAQIIGHFSRANCVVNNESITFLPLDPFPRGVVSWHRPSSGFLHYAGHEDPVSCALPPCPTSPNPLEDALCSTFDACLWPFTYHTINGRWAAIHNLHGLDDDNALQTGPWEVEGRHTVLYGIIFGFLIYDVTATGPVTDCSL